MKPVVTKEVKDFVNYYVGNVLYERKAELRRRCDHETDNQMRVIITQKLIEVIEISVSLEDMIHPTRIANNDQEDDCC